MSHHLRCLCEKRASLTRFALHAAHHAACHCAATPAWEAAWLHRYPVSARHLDERLTARQPRPMFTYRPALHFVDSMSILAALCGITASVKAEPARPQPRRRDEHHAAYNAVCIFCHNTAKCAVRV